LECVSVRNVGHFMSTGSRWKHQQQHGARGRKNNLVCSQRNSSTGSDTRFDCALNCSSWIQSLDSGR
jgi:hypothetical protein